MDLLAHGVDHWGPADGILVGAVVGLVIAGLGTGVLTLRDWLLRRRRPVEWLRRRQPAKGS